MNCILNQRFALAGGGGFLAGLLVLAVPCDPVLAAGSEAAIHFRKDIQPLLSEYCYDCHGDGMDKGKVAFDAFKSDDELVGKRDLWWQVLKNVRAGLMPPEKKPRPSEEQKAKLATWIKGDVFGIDPNNPDPGRVTIRRLNRVEYRNTIRDLMGFDFKVEDELPPDDTGYGFDNIGDVLTISPLLLEKYMQAAETITAGAVPRVTRVVREENLPGHSFRTSDGKSAERYSFYDETTLGRTFNADNAGEYRLVLDVEVNGEFDFDPGRCQVVLRADDRALLTNEFGWQPGKKFQLGANEIWQPGEHRLSLELQPLTPAEKKKNSLNLRINSMKVQGPLAEKHWVRPKNFDLFFSKDPPVAAAERSRYAREVLSRFASKAYRRPADVRTIDRLVAIAEGIYSRPGKRFEDGVAQAIVPVLASPRFLFRIEENEPRSSRREEADAAGANSQSPLTSAATTPFPFVDQYSLASRLSYFLWSTMPDDELLRLAGRGELRRNLGAQMKRMLGDRRSEALIENFTGQWLQVRDVEGIDINARAVLARDNGQERDFQRSRRRFQELRDIPDEKLTPEQKAELEQMRAQFRRRFGNRQNIELDRELRRALRQETEMCFAYVLREDRSVLELIDSDYTFLNERLAKHYGLTNLNVTGGEMRRVGLPKDDPRGGVLTQGAVLIVTSNPTRTSPVKRGLFILDNILGAPTPPPPPDVPLLEDSEKGFKERTPTLREVLAVHREKPLCSSCHNRMDPLGLALENFNALGMWREKERGQPIDAAGKLITGEAFHDVRDVKKTISTGRRTDFYRCLTEKLLTYALGRGLEYYDVDSVDRIVERLDQQNGRFSALLLGVIESAPFQMRRSSGEPIDRGPIRAVEQRADIKQP
jgi:hypothetical protein